MTADHERPRPLPCPHPGPAHDPDGRRQAVKIYEAAQEAHDSKEGDHDNNHEDRRQRMTADHASGPAAALSFSGIRPGSWMGGAEAATTGREGDRLRDPGNVRPCSAPRWMGAQGPTAGRARGPPEILTRMFTRKTH